MPDKPKQYRLPWGPAVPWPVPNFPSRPLFKTPAGGSIPPGQSAPFGGEGNPNIPGPGHPGAPNPGPGSSHPGTTPAHPIGPGGAAGGWSGAAHAGPAQSLPDPLVLDLDLNGIETASTWVGGHFDLNGNGLLELTGWVDPHDGVLVMDRNGDGIINDGKELFGDQTILKDGRKAPNGFQALAELDTNKDGKIDAQDAAFTMLRVWTDQNSDGYGGLLTLNELGIESISLSYTQVNVLDPQGNTETAAGTYTKADGTTAAMSNDAPEVLHENPAHCQDRKPLARDDASCGAYIGGN